MISGSDREEVTIMALKMARAGNFRWAPARMTAQVRFFIHPYLPDPP